MAYLSRSGKTVEYEKLCRMIDECLDMSREEIMSIRLPSIKQALFQARAMADIKGVDVALQVNRDLLPQELSDLLELAGTNYRDDLKHVSSIVFLSYLNFETKEEGPKAVPSEEAGQLFDHASVVEYGFEPFMTDLATASLNDFNYFFNIHSTIFLTDADGVSLSAFAYLMGRIKINSLLIAKGMKVENLEEEIRHPLASVYANRLIRDFARSSEDFSDQELEESEEGAAQGLEMANRSLRMLSENVTYSHQAPLIWDIESKL